MHPLLQTIPIFAGLSEEALGQLLPRARQLNLPQDAVLVQEGESSNRLFVIGRGTVRVCKSFGQPAQIELARLGDGDFFGEMCILETLPRSATVQALTPVLLFSLASTDFFHLYRVMPEQYSILILNIARDLSRRLRRLDEVFAACN